MMQKKETTIYAVAALSALGMAMGSAQAGNCGSHKRNIVDT